MLGAHILSGLHGGGGGGGGGGKIGHLGNEMTGIRTGGTTIGIVGVTPGVDGVTTGVGAEGAVDGVWVGAAGPDV
jgi:hypothetical protein